MRAGCTETNANAMHMEKQQDRHGRAGPRPQGAALRAQKHIKTYASWMRQEIQEDARREPHREKCKQDARRKRGTQSLRTIPRQMQMKCIWRSSETGTGARGRPHRSWPREPKSIERLIRNGCRQLAIVRCSLFVLVMIVGSIVSYFGWWWYNFRWRRDLVCGQNAQAFAKGSFLTERHKSTLFCQG